MHLFSIGHQPQPASAHDLQSLSAVQSVTDGHWNMAQPHSPTLDRSEMHVPFTAQYWLPWSVQLAHAAR